MLESERVKLRGLELTDVPELMEHWNTKEVREFLKAISPHSYQEEEEWVRNTWKERKKGVCYVFGIILKELNLYIGNVELRVDSNINRRGNLGIVIFNPNYWNKGLGSEAIQLIFHYGFSNLNLHSIELEVFSNNIRAQRSYKKCGFKESGIRRQAIFFEGKYIDSILMDILKTEYISMKSE